MATLDDIYDFETSLEEGIRAILVAEDIPAFTRKNAPEDFQKDVPRVEIRIQAGGALGAGHMALCPDGFEREDIFNFSLGLQVVTAPAGTPEENLLHPALRSKVRQIMATFQNVCAGDTTNFPNHSVTRLTNAGTESSLKEEDGFEFSMLRYNGMFGIREDVWPT